MSNYDYLNTFLNFTNKQFVYKVNPNELLSPINYDIFIKYLFLKNINNKYIKKIYLSHIKAFNNFKEPDGSKKNKSDFLNNCINLLKSNYSINTIIPVSNQGIIIDGSHRVAISIIKNQEIMCTNFKTEDLYFDFIFFKSCVQLYD